MRVTFAKPTIGLLQTDLVLIDQMTSALISVNNLALSSDGMSATLAVSDIAMDSQITVGYNSRSPMDTKVIATTRPPINAPVQGNSEVTNPLTSDPAPPPELGVPTGGGGGSSRSHHRNTSCL